MQKLFLSFIIFFSFCNGLELELNSIPTKKLINLLVPSFTEKLAMRYPRFFSKFATLRPSWAQEMEALVKQGASVNNPLELRERHPNDYRSPLDFALDYGQLDLFSVILEHGAHPETNYNSTNQSILMRAAELEYTEAIAILLAHHANPARKDRQGFTARDYTSLEHNKQLISHQKQKIA